MIQRWLNHRLSVLFSLLLLWTAALFMPSAIAAQDDPFYLPSLTFVDQTKNRIQDFSGNFGQTFAKAMVEGMFGNRKVRIVHLGDSHIQADIFTDHVRRSIGQLLQGNGGARGLVFPYNLAHSNNPTNYKIVSSNRWETQKSTKTITSDNFGIFGIMLQTTDSLIRLDIQQTDTALDPFNRIQLWYGLEGTATIRIDNGKMETPLIATADTSTEFTLQNYVHRLTIVIRQSGTFTFFGAVLTNDLPGLEYINIGLNGATAASFNRSVNLGRHLQRLSPDFVVVSLGTNDAYHPSFNRQWFFDEFRKFISNVRKSASNVPILLTTPNDHNKKGSDISQKSSLVHQVIAETAQTQNLALWDFYEVMGGAGAITRWVSDSLAASDMVHLNVRGYGFQAVLFYQALLALYDEWAAVSGKKVMDHE